MDALDRWLTRLGWLLVSVAWLYIAGQVGLRLG